MSNTREWEQPLTMNWKKIDPGNLPSGEVLVSLFGLGRYRFMVGTLIKDGGNIIFCESVTGIVFCDPDYYVTLAELADTLPQD